MKLYPLLILLACFIQPLAARQKMPGLSQKLSPLLAGQKPLTPREKESVQPYWIVTKNIPAFLRFLESKGLSNRVTRQYAATGLVVLNINRYILDTCLLPTDLVLFTDVLRVPHEEMAVNGLDISTNKINTVHSTWPALNGRQLVVSIKENNMDPADIDFTGRLLSQPPGSGTITAHATIMATIIGGGGNTYYTGKGAAWGATLSTADFATLLPETDAIYRQYHISVQNHSYGTGIENYYGADAAAYDASTQQNRTLLHIFSAGNVGDQASTTGRYSGIEGYANLTGSFKMAKNILTIGAIDSFYRVTQLSSRGPAYDGRIKPELAAFGEDGSSGSAAIVSGIALLVQQAYQEQNNGALPDNTLQKAILLNTADDIGKPGPDFETGYGSVNAFNAIKAIKSNQYLPGTIGQGETQSYPLQVPAGIQRVRVLLCWNDPAAAANASTALLNDLDLQLQQTATGKVWQPWVLNSFPNIDSLQQLAYHYRDSLNPQEQVTIENPLAGNYTIQVTGHRVTGNQPYWITYQFDTAESFQWYYPSATDNLYSGSTNTLRWAATVTAPGKLEYSTDSGRHWLLIQEGIDLLKGYYNWAVPDTFAMGLLKMTVATRSFLSDTVSISASLATGVGFNCPDSFLLYWNKPAGITGFRLYTLGNQYLYSIKETTDTAIILKKSTYPSLYYAVAPVLAAGGNLIKSYTFNYTTQGVDCYIKDFLADHGPDQSALITVRLASLYQLKSITLEKLTRQGFELLQYISPVTSDSYTFTDISLLEGANIYRLKIQLETGFVFYSRPETVYQFLTTHYLIFPNPVKAGSMLQILTDHPENARVLLFTATGQKVLEHALTGSPEAINLQKLQAGVYFIVVLKEGRREYQGSLLVE